VDDVRPANGLARRKMNLSIDGVLAGDVTHRKIDRLAQRIVQRQIRNPIRAVRAPHTPDDWKNDAFAMGDDDVFLVRNVNAPQIRRERRRMRVRDARPELDAAHRLVEAVTVIDVRGDGLGAHRVRNQVELVVPLRRRANDDLRPGALEIVNDLVLKFARRCDWYLVEPRWI